MEAGRIDVAKWILTHSAFGYYFGLFGIEIGYLVPYLEFGPFGCLGTISGVLALSLEYRSCNFDTCSRGRSSLKVISVWIVTYD